MREAWSRGPRMTEQEALLRTTSNRRTTRLDLGIEAFTFPRVFYAAARVPRFVDDFEALWEQFVWFPSSGAPRFKFGKEFVAAMSALMSSTIVTMAPMISCMSCVSFTAKRDITPALFRARDGAGAERAGSMDADGR